MKQEQTKNTADFWSFCLRVYGKRGVAPACLALQDAHDLDIVTLLYILWRASRSEAVADPGDAFALATEWRARVVGPLRAIRRDMKPGFAHLDAARSDPFREQIKALELAAEKQQVEAMAATPVTTRPAPGEDAARATLALWLGTEKAATVMQEPGWSLILEAALEQR